MGALVPVSAGVLTRFPARALVDILSAAVVRVLVAAFSVGAPAVPVYVFAGVRVGALVRVVAGVVVGVVLGARVEVRRGVIVERPSRSGIMDPY